MNTETKSELRRRIAFLEKENNRLQSALLNLNKPADYTLDLLKRIMWPQHTVEDDRIVSQAIDEAKLFLKRLNSVAEAPKTPAPAQ